MENDKGGLSSELPLSLPLLLLYDGSLFTLLLRFKAVVAADELFSNDGDDVGDNEADDRRGDDSIPAAARAV